MKFFNNSINNNEDVTGDNILTAYKIVLAHIFLLFCVGLIILFFKGFYIYIGWILAGIGLFTIGILFFVYQRLAKSSSNIRSVLSMPEFEDKSLEIKLIGGLASFKVSPEQNPRIAPQQTLSGHSHFLLTEHKSDVIEQRILKLIDLFEKDLVTEEEFKKAKAKLLEENI